MTTPNFLLGYSKQPVIWPDSSIERVPQTRSSVYLTISISLEPLFEPIELTTSNLECTELSDVKVILKISSIASANAILKISEPCARVALSTYGRISESMPRPVR